MRVVLIGAQCWYAFGVYRRGISPGAAFILQSRCIHQRAVFIGRDGRARSGSSSDEAETGAAVPEEGEEELMRLSADELSRRFSQP